MLRNSSGIRRTVEDLKNGLLKLTDALTQITRSVKSMNLQKQKRWLKRNVLWFVLLAIILFSFGTGIIVGTLVADKPEPVLAAVTEEPAFYQIVTENEPTSFEESEWQTFTATAYCPCKKCCGKWALNRPNGLVYTASSAIAEEGVTVAADWSILPAGTLIEIDGLGERIVQDRGGVITGNKIDLFFNIHQDALDFGVQEVLVRTLDK
jgi:3D (Asp-Asp-Asp) domain-containing protein